jgi:polysaccharide deacetylase 2 family uncharacterized protein YibQ
MGQPAVSPQPQAEDVAPQAARAAEPAAAVRVAAAPSSPPRLSVPAPTPAPGLQPVRSVAAGIAVPPPPAPPAPETVLRAADAVPAPPRAAPAAVATGRLPQIGVAEAEPEAAGSDDATSEDTAAEAPAEDADLPALQRNAAAFERDDRPLLAPILLDAGLDAVARARLAALPHPLSVAVDPSAPDAAEAAATYRAAGKEVVILASQIPPQATPADLEVTFASHRAHLPQAVALLDLPAGGFQEDRRLAQQIATILAGDGLGMITHDRGLNPAAQVAAQAGVPHAAVFRNLSEAGDDPAAMRRLLERARFRAGQQGATALLLTGAGAELDALLDWLAEGRDVGVALAPVSALLLTAP